MNAILLVWNYLKSNHEFQFLFTTRLNTDALENFFGTIRQQGGISDNPTPVQFSRAFRKLFFSSCLTSLAGNCVQDMDELLAQLGRTSNSKPLVNVLSQPQTPEIGPTDYRETNVSSNIFKENAIAYVSGYLFYKCTKIHSCSSCTEALVATNLDDSRKLFCHFKAYQQKASDFGGLHAPTNCYLNYITHLEDVFVQHFSIYTKSTHIGDTILKLLKQVPTTSQCCPEFPGLFAEAVFENSNLLQFKVCQP